MLSFFIRLLLHFSFSFITHAARCRSSSLLPFSFLSSDFVFFFSLVCPFLAALFPSSLLLSLAKPSLFQFLFFAYLFSAGQPCRSYSPETLSSVQNVCWVAPTLLDLTNCSIAQFTHRFFLAAVKKGKKMWCESPKVTQCASLPFQT